VSRLLQPLSPQIELEFVLADAAASGNPVTISIIFFFRNKLRVMNDAFEAYGLPKRQQREKASKQQLCVIDN